MGAVKVKDSIKPELLATKSADISTYVSVFFLVGSTKDEFVTTLGCAEPVKVKLVLICFS